MSDAAPSARGQARWTAAKVLKLMLIAQCLLAVLVAVGDLPPDLQRLLPGAGPSAPAVDVPVAPGNQTRRFEPSRLPMDQPPGPGFPADETVPRRLEFSTVDLPDRDGAALMTGGIAEGDAQRFADWLAALAEPPTAIALHSPGGSVRDALEIGRLIRGSGVPVVVASGAFCFSACPYILAGGAEREVSRNGHVGVHQHYFGENTYLPAFLLVSDIQIGQGEVMAYLDEMGVDPMLMVKGLTTPPDEIYILLPEELQDFALATRLTD